MINGIGHALIVRKQFLDLYFSPQNPKTWEMRSRPTWIRGRIGLIEAGSGLIVGETTIVASPHQQMFDDFCGGNGIFTRILKRKFQLQNYEKTYNFHQVDDIRLFLKWQYPWVLENSVRYDTPIKYHHPKGAVALKILL